MVWFMAECGDGEGGGLTYNQRMVIAACVYPPLLLVLPIIPLQPFVSQMKALQLQTRILH